MCGDIWMRRISLKGIFKDGDNPHLILTTRSKSMACKVVSHTLYLGVLNADESTLHNWDSTLIAGRMGSFFMARQGHVTHPCVRDSVDTD